MPIALLLAMLIAPDGLAADRSVLGNASGYFRGGDYPAESVHLREEGLVAFRLLLDTAGRVAGCTILQSSGFERLDTATCRIATDRMRFAPALDRLGQPTHGTFDFRVTWKLGPNHK